MENEKMKKDQLQPNELNDDELGDVSGGFFAPLVFQGRDRADSFIQDLPYLEGLDPREGKEEEGGFGLDLRFRKDPDPSGKKKKTVTM